MKQLKKSKNNKKKGFTLVELIAVIAIIGILAAILVPTISGFINKSKKTKVVEQARQFAMAVESRTAEGNFLSPTVGATKNAVTVSTAAGDSGFRELVGAVDAGEVTTKVFPKLKSDTSYADAVAIAGGGSFTIDDNGKLAS